jgi:hypothetical protein
MSRPSSASAYTGFGYKSQRAPNHLEINPKVSNYQTDGAGRDYYIKLSNGGFNRSYTNNYFKNPARIIL